MDSTTTLPDKIALLLQASREYVESKVELEVLKGADKIAKGTSSMITFIICIAMGMVALLLLALGGVIIINQAMHHASAGYFIMAGIVLLLLVLILTLGRKAIKKMVVNTILKNIDND